MANLPSRIGQFEVLRQIGSGGMGAVYLGRDPELDRRVAIKVIREEVHDQEVLERFFREARAAAALRHPNIITIYASGQHEHQPYMVMEFVDGESFAEIIRSRRKLALADKLSYLEQVCSGLHFAHRAGIVHRDIKPANVMVDREGMVRILDFGIARIEGSAMTQDGALMGSLNYMSPEQMLGRPIDHRSDIFSVGSLAYELLCYQQAFKGGLNDGLLQRLPHEDPPPLRDLYPGLPPALEKVIMRALQKAPENRFQDLAEMGNALLEVHNRPQPEEDERTVVIPRPGASRSDSSVVQVASSLGLTAAPEPPPLGIELPPLGTSELPPIGTSVSLPGSEGFGEPAATPQTPPPESQTWQVKKKAAQTPTRTATTAMAAPTQTRTAATVIKAPTSVKPPNTVIPRPQPAQRGSSRKWVLGGSAVAAVVIGGALALPWLTAEPPSVLDRERPAIEAAMERYRIGYQNRSLTAVAAVFPTLPRDARQAMQRTFTNCLVYEVTFAGMQVEITPTDESLAQVDVSSTHTCTPQSGGRQTTTTQRETFTLRKMGDSWVVNSATAVAGASANRTQ